MSVPVYVKSSLFNVTAVAPGAFKDCKGLEGFSLDAGSKVSVIGEGAFWGCTNLASVALRNSVVELGASTFLGCSALTHAALSAGLTNLPAQTFAGCTKLASVAFPPALTSVDASAFLDCVALTNVALPSAVTSVSAAAFQGCTRLAAATFPGVSRLGANAFAATGLRTVTIPAALTEIPQGAFAECTNLLTVGFEGSPLTFGSAAFKNCAALTNLPVASSLTAIASTAFDGCRGIKTATLPVCVRDVANNLFENCSSLVSVTTLGAVTNVGEYAFANTAITAYTLPSDANYRSVDAGTFFGCSCLTSVLAPASVTSAIKSEAFARCTALTDLALTNCSADAINAFAFYGCTALGRLALPATVGAVGKLAFGASPALTNVAFRGNAPTADATAFEGTTQVFVYYLRCASGWSNLLAGRPTVLLDPAGSAEALSFAVWAVRRGLLVSTGLSTATLAALFEAESPSSPGLANGAIYAFGANLAGGDRVSLLHMELTAEGTPVAVTPALASGASEFVALTVEAAASLTDATWSLPLSAVALPDATRAGYTPTPTGDAIPPCAFFRLKLAPRE